MVSHVTEVDDDLGVVPVGNRRAEFGGTVADDDGLGEFHDFLDGVDH